jgi:alanine racemase/UDP-N-acetylmuramoyl-tripeptide--D-alanyl-D-alanine ligase
MEIFDLRRWPQFAATGAQLTEPSWVDQICIDSRTIASPNALFVALHGRRDGHSFIADAAARGARYALVDRHWHQSVHTVPEGITLLPVDNTLNSFQQIAKAYRQQQKCQVVAIAGTHGKTMVKDLLQQLCMQCWPTAASPGSFNSQIGVPLSLLTIESHHQIALIEAAISHCGEIDKLAEIIAPDAVIVTPIANKHLPTLGSIDTASNEIAKLAMCHSADRWRLLPSLQTFGSHFEASQVEVSQVPTLFWMAPSEGFPHASFISGEHAAAMAYRVDFPDGSSYCGTTRAAFDYFLDLLNIAIKAAWLLGIPAAAIGKVLDSYYPEPMRTEIWKTPQGAAIINDSYCSDSSAVERAMRFYSYVPTAKRKVLVFGGLRHPQPHHGEWRRTAEAIGHAHIDWLLLTNDSPLRVMTHLFPHTALSTYETFDKAVEAAAAHTLADDALVVASSTKISQDLLTEAFQGSVDSNQCIVNLEAIKSNIAAIRHLLPPLTRIMVMVKALAYGTDSQLIARFLECCGIDILGVSYVDEAIALRRAGISQALFAINVAPYEAAKAIAWQLEVGVSDRPCIDALETAAQRANSCIKVHLHVDTGMSRLGCRPEAALELARLINVSPHLQLEGIMTHFSCADLAAEDSFTMEQIARFDAVIAQLSEASIAPRWLHAANSAGVMRFRLPQYNMVRIGLAAYGLGSNHTMLQPALALRSRIVAINHCLAGDSVSYGRRYRITEPCKRIAVLPIGYFDGLHRKYSGSSHVIIRGKAAPMVGNICMDFMMVDISDIPTASVGDQVLIFGQDDYGSYASPEEFASRGSSIVHELMTCLGPRIPRIFIHEEKPF